VGVGCIPWKKGFVMKVFLPVLEVPAEVFGSPKKIINGSEKLTVEPSPLAVAHTLGIT